jgi:peptidoglycan/xylan/chitin deacetylase (PgdA/CDA1 family)
MKWLLRSFVGVLFFISGAPILIREIICRKKVTILTYHCPEPRIFEKHIRYLKKRFHFITMNALVRAIKDDNWNAIPPRAMVMTLDDGYKENYKIVPIFAKYGINPTIYLCGNIVNTNRHFWFGPGLPDITHLKRANHARRLQELKESQGYEPEKEYDERQALNYEEMKIMMKYVDFQSHTKTHPVLTRCDNAEVRGEIAGSKRILEELLAKRITHFSYPNGDYSEREVQEVIRSGYESARTLDVGWNQRMTNPYRLKAMGIQDQASLFVLCAQVHGLFGYVKYAMHGSFKGIRPPLIT